MNVVVLRGDVSSELYTRELPSGSLVLDFDVTTRDDDGTAHVPVVIYEPKSGDLSLGPDDKVVVIGEVRRRFFQAGGRTQSRTEVVAESVVPIRQKARWRKATQAVVETLDDTLS